VQGIFISSETSELTLQPAVPSFYSVGTGDVCRG